MKVRGVFPVGIILILLLAVSSSFAQQYEDVVYLKDGGVRRGLILEQIPGESVKLKTNYGEIFVIRMSDISKIAKVEKTSPVAESVAVIDNAPRAVSDVKLESWYTYWGLGFSSNSYTGDLKQQVGWSNDDSFSMGFDFFGFYWPLQNQQTILGGVYNASTDRRSKSGSWEHWVSGQFSISAMHFIQSGIGEGPFVRADLGWGFLSSIDDWGDQWAEDEDTSGPAALFGVGYGLPVGAGGTRILFNVNYALRPGIDEQYSKGSVRALSITVGALF